MTWLRTTAEIIGWVTIVCVALGMMPIGYDFRYCFAPTGSCFKGEPNLQSNARSRPTTRRNQMNRASPVDLRKAIEIANTFVKVGILFVPVPVLSEADHAALVADVNKRLASIEGETNDTTN